MKHIRLLALAIAFVMAAVACAPAHADRVLTPSSDTQLRPGFKPDQVTVLDFNATWCGPCKTFSPVFHRASDKFAQVKFYSVDIDEYPETASAFGIEAVPTVIIVRTNGQTQTIVGLGEYIEDVPDGATNEEYEEGAYSKFCKLIMKAIVNR